VLSIDFCTSFKRSQWAFVPDLQAVICFNAVYIDLPMQMLKLLLFINALLQ